MRFFFGLFSGRKRAVPRADCVHEVCQEKDRRVHEELDREQKRIRERDKVIKGLESELDFIRFREGQDE